MYIFVFFPKTYGKEQINVQFFVLSLMHILYIYLNTLNKDIRNISETFIVLCDNLKVWILLRLKPFVTFYRFPFDTQNCTIELVFSEYEESEVSWILLKGFLLENRTNNSNPAWDIIHQYIEISDEEIFNLKEGEISPGKLSKLIYTVTLRRQPRTAIVYVICPTVAISAFNIISFVLPTGEGSFNFFIISFKNNLILS